ncbi:MAG TPA: glycosyltransferase [Candidatus Saccharimonadales bacterium]|nr:glycosyltransferase [Candidatus Saccharimonadales bacterium]
MAKNPKVSVVTITYNHEKYIREALDSFVAQKTNFDFEVIVADDCSTDKTPEIIKEYEKAYPNIFKPVLRKKNIGAVANFIDALQLAQGEYIALCEGDDYWTDPEKLQIQVDFLQKNPDYAFCFHPVNILFEDDKHTEVTNSDLKDKQQVTATDLLKGNFIYTNSVVYRKQNYSHMPGDVMPLDWYLHLYHAQFGKVGFIGRVMSVYRRHPGGMWWESDKNLDGLLQKQGLRMIALYIELLKLYGQNAEQAKIIYYRMNDLFFKLFAIDKKYGTNLVEQALAEYPEMVKPFLAYETQELLEREKIILEQKGAIEDLEQKLQKEREQLKKIKSSRFWKMRNQAAKMRGKEVI